MQLCSTHTQGMNTHFKTAAPIQIAGSQGALSWMAAATVLIATVKCITSLKLMTVLGDILEGTQLY